MKEKRFSWAILVTCGTLGLGVGMSAGGCAPEAVAPQPESTTGDAEITGQTEDVTAQAPYVVRVTAKASTNPILAGNTIGVRLSNHSVMIPAALLVFPYDSWNITFLDKSNYIAKHGVVHSDYLTWFNKGRTLNRDDSAAVNEHRLNAPKQALGLVFLVNEGKKIEPIANPVKFARLPAINSSSTTCIPPSSRLHVLGLSGSTVVAKLINDTPKKAERKITAGNGNIVSRYEAMINCNDLANVDDDGAPLVDLKSGTVYGQFLETGTKYNLFRGRLAGFIEIISPRSNTNCDWLRFSPKAYFALALDQKWFEKEEQDYREDFPHSAE